MKTIYIVLLLTSISFAQHNWEWQNPLPQGNSLAGSHFFNSTTGFMTGLGGTILKTTNSGETWVRKESGTLAFLYSIHFISESVGWAAGDSVKILKTTDAGKPGGSNR